VKIVDLAFLELLLRRNMAEGFVWARKFPFWVCFWWWV